jgi:hypothetical protein
MKISLNKNAVLIYSILIISSASAALYVVDNIKISPDSMRFGLISQQILSGNGIRVPLIRLEDDYVPVNGTIPFLDQLPLVPLLYAAMGGVTSEKYLPAQVLNVISHVVTALFTFLLMRKMYDNQYTALLAGILVSLSYPMMKATHQMSSEPLFIALTMAAIYFLILSRDSRFSRNFFIACIFASASIFARNAGVAILPVLFWEAFYSYRKRRPGSEYKPPVLALTIPLFTTASIFIRNYIISGSLRGFHQASPDRLFSEAIAGTIDMIFQQFLLGENAVILIKLSMVFFAFCVLFSSKLRNRLSISMSAGLDTILVFALSYTTLICLTMARQQWHYELRFVYPLVPVLFFIIIVMIVCAWDSVKFKKFSRASLIGMILTLSLLAIGTVKKTYSNTLIFSYKQEKAYALLNSCAYDWIKDNLPKDMIIATNRPFHLGFFGGYSTVALPHKRFNPTINVPEDMESVLPERMTKFGAQVLALFEEADERYEGKYIAALFNKRESNDKFYLAYECSDGVVYTLKE